MKIEYRYFGERIFDHTFSVCYILRNEMPCCKKALGSTYDASNMLLPFQGNTSEIRLITYFINNIVIFSQFVDNLLHHFFLDTKQPSVLIQCVGLCTRNVTNSVNVIYTIHG